MLKKARCTVDWRSIRDLNSGGATNALSHFECDPFDLLGNAPYSNPPKSSPEKGEKSRREQQIFNCRKRWIFDDWSLESRWQLPKCLLDFECSLLRPLEYICIFNFVARNFPQGVISSAPSYDHLSNAPQHKFCTVYYNSLRGKCQFFAGGKMLGGKMSVGCICNERLRFLHDVLQGRQVVQNVAGFQGMIGVLIKTERRAVGAGCGGDGGNIAPGVGGA